MTQAHRLRPLKCLAFAGLLLSNGVYASLNDGLVAYYPFNGNANDESGNGNHGSENGVVEYIEGKVGQAVKLNGTLSYIRVANPETKFDKHHTITGWVSTKGRGMPVLAKYSWNDAQGGTGFSLSSTTPDGNRNPINGSTFFAFTKYSEGPNPSKYPSYTLPTNEFKYVSATYDEGQIKLYVDGILVSQSTIQHRGSLDNPYDMLIGAYWHNHGNELSLSRTFDGTIDELRIYNRALSPEEVTALYSGVISDENCKHASYSFKKKTLTVPFIEMPVIDFLTGLPTDKTELWKGKLKQVTGTVNRFKVLSPSITQVIGDSTSSCPATYTVETGTLTIPYIDVPTGIEIGNKQQGQDTEVFKATMIWDQIGKSFVVQEVKQVAD